MNNKLVSIIIAAYNAEKYLRRGLDSILNQPYSNVEVMIMDDGSRDETLAIANEYATRDSRVRVFSQDNKGPAEARNRLIECSNGDYIAICDADDYNCENRFVRQVEYLDSHTDIDLVSGGFAKISALGKVVFATKNRQNPDYDAMILKGIRNPIPHGGIMFRRDIVEKIGKPFYRNIIGEDIDMLARLLFAGCRFAYMDGFVYYYQMGSLLQENFAKNLLRDKERDIISELVAGGKILDTEESLRRYSIINDKVIPNIIEAFKFKVKRLCFGLFADYVWRIKPRMLQRFIYNLAINSRYKDEEVYSFDEMEQINLQKGVHVR